MKKILVTALVALSTIAVTAQDKKFRFGPKAGVNFANLSGDLTESKMKTGFHAGFVFEYKFTGNLSLQPEAIFSTQGNKEEFTDSDGVHNYGETKLYYINVPVLFKYNNLGVRGLGIGVGPQLGVLVAARYDMNTSYPSIWNAGELDIMDYTNSIDVSLVFNLEYEFKFGMFFQGRYNLGLTDINDGLLPPNYRFRNSVFQISTGYKF